MHSPQIIYIISILISSIILLSLILWISVRVIKNTIPIKTNIPQNNAAHGIWYNTGKAFRIDKLIKNGMAIPSITPGTSAFTTQKHFHYITSCKVIYLSFQHSLILQTHALILIFVVSVLITLVNPNKNEQDNKTITSQFQQERYIEHFKP